MVLANGPWPGCVCVRGESERYGVMAGAERPHLFSTCPTLHEFKDLRLTVAEFNVACYRAAKKLWLVSRPKWDDCHIAA